MESDRYGCHGHSHISQNDGRNLILAPSDAARAHRDPFPDDESHGQRNIADVDSSKNRESGIERQTYGRCNSSREQGTYERPWAVVPSFSSQPLPTGPAHHREIG